MDINQIVPARMYSWVYSPSTDQWCENNLKKGGRSGLAPNPLFGRVTVRAVKVGQAATIEMYLNRAAKLNPNFAPSEDYTPRMEKVEGHPCVFRYISSGENAVFIMEPKTTKLQYFVDGREATPEELETIKLYRKARQARDPLKVKVNFAKVENLANLEGELVEADYQDEE